MDAGELSHQFYLGPRGGKVPWAGWGALSRLIAFILRPCSPPVLILSLPRSGSSWVGSLLGSAPDALYLREPLTQSDPAITAWVVFDFADHPELEAPCRRLADRAFLSLPDFKDVVVYDPAQWSLRGRRRRRLVVKEVNPRACAWYVSRYRPRVIFLLRHPAAVAWSSRKHGWIGPSPEDWRIRGRESGDALCQARDALKNYPACETVHYESLCHDPLGGFRRLYDFAGLTWTDTVADMISRGSRASKTRTDAWRVEAPPENVTALRVGYNASDAPWYRADDEW